MPIAWHPKRWWKFCMSQDQEKEIEPISTEQWFQCASVANQMRVSGYFPTENCTQRLDIVQKSLQIFLVSFFELKYFNNPRPKCVHSFFNNKYIYIYIYIYMQKYQISLAPEDLINSKIFMKFWLKCANTQYIYCVFKKARAEISNKMVVFFLISL